jgi:guanylate cyclase
MSLGLRRDTEPGRRRRIQTINVIAMMAIALNLIFSTVFFVAIAPAAPWALRILNLLLVAGYGGSLALNAAARTDLAMWLVNWTGLANIVISSLALGLGLGSIAFFVVVPLTAVLTSREDDRVVPLVFTIAALIAVAVVVAIEPAVPITVAGTHWEAPVLAGNIASVVVFATVVALYYRRRVDHAQAEIAAEHARSESLLLNILPKETADRLKAGERIIADSADDVAVLFADLVGSTPLTRRIESQDLVAVLNRVFSSFDDLADEHGLEKIKTMGDSYIAVAGLPTPRPGHLVAAADMALAMRRVIRDHSLPGYEPLQLRIGLHTGSVVAGVIGKRKFSYDLWGDTVNIASRMESQGIPGEIQVTQEIRDRLDGMFDFEPRGTIEVRGEGPMATYLLKGRTA